MAENRTPGAGIVAVAKAVLPKRISIKLWRRLSQAAGVVILGQWSFYGLFRCPFLVPFVSCRNCPVITCHGRLFSMFWGFWILLPVAAVVFGRAFCSWFCPAGLINQLLGKMAVMKMTTKSTLGKILPYGKYVALVLALYLWLIRGQVREAIPIRIGEFFPAVILTMEHADLAWLVRTLFVITIFGLSVLAASAWCRFACPTGGLLELLKGRSIFRIDKDHHCNGCDCCRQICPAETRPAETDCTNCGDCLDACPQDAIRFGPGRR